jgi:hypothetical protein
VGIFIWMQANGLGTDDISFVDACYGRYGPADAGCDTLADEGIEWDTPILCHSSGPADGGTYVRAKRALERSEGKRRGPALRSRASNNR